MGPDITKQQDAQQTLYAPHVLQVITMERPEQHPADHVGGAPSHQQLVHPAPPAAQGQLQTQAVLLTPVRHVAQDNGLPRGLTHVIYAQQVNLHPGFVEISCTFNPPP